MILIDNETTARFAFDIKHGKLSLLMKLNANLSRNTGLSSFFEETTC